VFVDLGATPLANGFVGQDADPSRDRRYPLVVRICDHCLLVQLPEVVGREAIFDEYAYFSSYSASWVEHAARLADTLIERFDLDADSLVLELASNDGYFLRQVQTRGIGVLGVEPARNVAEVARAAGVPTVVEFFGRTLGETLARERAADVVVANNVLAHVPDLHDFVAGIAAVLQSDGVVSFEFPHIMRLIAGNQFDTIYHEHYSYLSLLVVGRVLAEHGLRVFDVEQLATHGGSLRVLACAQDARHRSRASVSALLSEERSAGLHRIEGYEGFAERVVRTCTALRSFLDGCRARGEMVVAYGAAAKGNTLLNVAGVTRDDVAFVVDRSPHKQGLALPGSRLPICDPSAVGDARPAHLLILPWNLRDEVVEQMAHIRSWGGRFVVAVPDLEVFA
jgi:SAM-dependent methyltransferase